MCFYFFRELLLWVYRRLYRLAPGFLMSTVFLGLQHWTFRPRSRTLGLISAFYHQRRWHGGTWTLLSSERCHVTKKKPKKVKESEMMTWCQNPVGTAMNHMPLFPFFNEWIVTTTPWRMWQSFDRTWLGWKTERTTRELRTKKLSVYISSHQLCSIFFWNGPWDFVNRLVTISKLFSFRFVHFLHLSALIWCC